METGVQPVAMATTGGFLQHLHFFHLTPPCLPCYSDTRGMRQGMEMIDSEDCSIHHSSIAWTPYSHSWRVLATSLLRGNFWESPSSLIFQKWQLSLFQFSLYFVPLPFFVLIYNHFLLQRVFPDPEIEPRAPALHGDSLLTEPPGKPCLYPGELYFLSTQGKNKQDVGDMEGAFSRLPAGSKVLFKRPHKGSMCVGECLKGEAVRQLPKQLSIPRAENLQQHGWT